MYMKNVLLPYDGSDASARALRHLIQMPRERWPEQIHLLNVQISPMFHGQILTHEDVRIAHEAQLGHGRKVLRPAEEELLSAGAPFRSHVLLGEPELVIAEQAVELGCDHIVMGTRGMGTIRSLVLGSVATKTVHLAQVPVTLVK
jgi:nucleotide-binding universal stress UspA family protein